MRRRITQDTVDAIDWSLSNHDLAKKYKVTARTIQGIRKKFGIKPPSRDRYPWDTVDWNLPDTVIAKTLGCNISSVSTYRKRKGIPKTFEHRGRKTKYPWHTVDWTLQNVVIAENLGCSHELVRRYRSDNGIPQSPRYHKCVHPRPSKYDWGSVDWSKNDKDIAAALGCNKSIISPARKRLGIPPAKRAPMKPKRDWSKADWTRNDYQVAKDVGCTPRAAQQYRLKHDIPHHPGYRPRRRRETNA